MATNSDHYPFALVNIPAVSIVQDWQDGLNVNDSSDVKENMDIAQGKLVMGYRCNVDYLDEEKYYSLLLGSRILGGGADSKLFINVREKDKFKS